MPSQRHSGECDALERYLRQLVGQIGDIDTELRVVHERVWGDIGVLTNRLDQTYTYEGNAVKISAPTTLVFRRDGGEWRIALSHSVPVAEQG